MRFLYTGAATPLGVQRDKELSLGGNVSSTIIPNNSISNVFDDISWKSIRERFIETKAIVLENNTSGTVTNFHISYEYPINAIFKLEVAFATLVNNESMETLGNKRDTPYYAEFQEADVDVVEEIDNTITIASIAPGERIGMWIRRSIIRDSYETVECYTEIADSILADPCCEESVRQIELLTQIIDTMKSITIIVQGDFQILVPRGKMFEWIFFRTTFPFDFSIGTTSGGSEVLSTIIEDKQPIMVNRTVDDPEILYFKSIPINATVTYKIT